MATWPINLLDFPESSVTSNAVLYNDVTDTLQQTTAPSIGSDLTNKTYVDSVAGGSGITALTGDVTATGPGSVAATIASNSVTTAKINNSAVTYAKIQNEGVTSLLGNPTASPASPSEISLGASLSFSGTTIQRAALTGDVTAAANSNATTIANNAVTTAKINNNAVTYAKMQQAAAGNVVLCNPTSAAANYSTVALAVSQLLGRGASGNLAAIVLGTNLSMTGTTLNAAGGAGFSTASVAIQKFIANGTYTPTANMKYCMVIACGGGGGGGGAGGNIGSSAAGGGGGGAGNAIAFFTAAQIGASQAVTIGSSGAGGTASGTTGSNGSDGTATTLGALLSCSGGRGGPGMNASASFSRVIGGAGGSMNYTVASVAIAGQDGQGGIAFGSNSFPVPGTGGNSSFFGGNGGAGQGGPGAGATNTQVNGTSGEPGRLVVIEFLFS